MSDQNAVDLSGLEDVFEWFKSHKNLLIGVVLVALLGVAGSSFVKRQLRESDAKPWRAVFSNDSPWTATPDELAALAASSDVKATRAEPFVRYWEAVRRFEQNEAGVAVQKLSDLKTSYATHPLCSVKLPNPDDPAKSDSVVTRVVAEMQRLEQWGKTLPVPSANPPPKPKTVVTLITERGDIILALYSDLSPKSCDAFVKTAPLLKDRFVARSMTDQWVELGQEADGKNVEVKDLVEGFPPFDENRLSHFAGCVSFRQQPFTTAPFFGDLRIDLKTDFKEDGRTTVFALVVQGLDLLTSIAKDEHKPDAPSALKSPVKITDVKVEPFDPAKIPQAPPRDGK